MSKHRYKAWPSGKFSPIYTINIHIIFITTIITIIVITIYLAS